MNRYDRLLDLDYAADFFGEEIAGVGNADAQALASGADVRGGRNRGAGEHGEVRRKHPFGTAGHDQCDFVFHRSRREFQMLRKSLAQGRHRIFAGKIVHPAVALSLAEYGQDRFRRDLPRFDEPQKARYVAGTLGGNANDVDRSCRLTHSASPFDQKINRRSVQPIT